MSKKGAYSFDGETLVFEGKKFAPKTRTFDEMRPVLLYPKRGGKMSPGTPLYRMYREVLRFSHLRYDMTLVLPVEVCGEHNKTFGHVHPRSPKGAPWSEAYEVLSGEAHFLLQKINQLGVQDAVLLAAKKGDCFLVPPGYGHVTINPGKKELLLANLVCDDFAPEYGMFAQHRGACAYELSSGKLVKNTHYGDDFEVRKADAVKFSSAFGVYAPFAKKTLLEAAEIPSAVEFLFKPEMFY